MKTTTSMKKLFIGLGNPGKKYQNTRHNIGQTIIDRINQPVGTYCNTFLPKNAIFLKTGQYMNNSGIFVQKTVAFYKVTPDHLYIIHDDLDLGVGEWRLQFDRGPAGHHGVESIIAHLNTQAFWRFRVGIGHPQPTATLSPSKGVEDYVLKPFMPAEKVLIKEVIDKIVVEIQKIL